MRRNALLLIALGTVLFIYLVGHVGAKEENQGVAGDTSTFKGAGNMEKATFAAGCFWHVEEAFRRVEGVQATSVGYTGGDKKDPTYREVCMGTTGHAEAVELLFDPEIVSYEELLDVFWKEHDPTQRNRQGPDVGHQYRSAIFYHTPEQEAAAKASQKTLEKSGKYSKPVVTEILPAETFWRAEDYHPQYFQKNGLRRCPL